MARRRRAIVASGTGIVVLCLGVAAGPLSAGATATSGIDVAALRSSVTVGGIMGRLDALQTIADANGGNRAIGTSGYTASGDYIEGVLTAAGYTPRRQPFQFTESVDTYALTLTDSGGHPLAVVGAPLKLSPSTPDAGIVGVQAVEPATATGCSADDWAGVNVSGRVAVVSRGGCTYAAKNLAAAGAGAAAVIVYNNTRGTIGGSLAQGGSGYVPMVGVSQQEGAAITSALGDGPVTVSLRVGEKVTVIDSFNIIADTPTGNPDNTVMVGAHLDSVSEGPGINDNGSGSAAILETAVQLAAAGPLTNRVRFAWWGGEEAGLVGSTHYVDDLKKNDPAEIGHIATYLNFDMVASPNYIISVYDADESTYKAPDGVPIPPGSIATEKAFTDYFDQAGQPWIDTAFDGRSDYEGFITAGIPASGLFTGADEVKTAKEAVLFGGTAGMPHDPNYHTPNDTVSKVNKQALGIMSGAIATVVGELANDTSAINGAQPTPAPTATPMPTTTPTAAARADSAPVDSAQAKTHLAATGSGELMRTGAPFGALLVAAGLLLALLPVRMKKKTGTS
ncbi:M28 family peptidase [Subtercola endophyticus]|uniref:M28 family peptidase n=1 Tax=Subtercola endophyticus TaxID=2895559 RepID=UPI001E455194|nr:M28 family peptidase [Subtercola endophyticus]UFS58219.1 M28 family peptidase [Subtercola endophyticus]